MNGFHANVHYATCCGMNRTVLLTTCILLLHCYGCGTNRYDASKNRHGRWKMYYDDGKQRLSSNGRYVHGKQVGHWKHYTPSGNLHLEEWYKPNGDILTCYFYPTGTLQLKGIARFISTEDSTFYRWEGNWNSYDTTGRLVHISFYKCGKFAWYVKRF
jgi:antitoxin component YwqK of YwqJK toxin-antitoxin module